VLGHPIVQEALKHGQKLYEQTTPKHLVAAAAGYYVLGMLNDARKAAVLRAIDSKPGRKQRVAIIGAGASGLAVMKELKQEGHEFVCYEKYDGIGGVFYYKETKGGVYDSTMLTISNYFMAYSDFPPKNEHCHHWMRQEYDAYLQAYAKTHDIAKHVQLNTEVVCVEREHGTQRWVVETMHNGMKHREVFDAVAVCTGTHQIENIPHIEGQETFEGRIVHTSQYKNAMEFTGKNVVCIGGGESATDVIKEISDVSATCFASLRRPPLIIPRYPEEKGYTNDMYTSRFHHYPNHMLWDIFVTIKYVLQKNFHHCPKYRKIAELALQSGGGESRQFLTKNENFVTNLVNGKCVVKPGIARLSKDRAYFKDGSSVKCDVVMLCTGYVDKFDFLKAVSIDHVRELYKHVYHPGIGTSVAFVGWSRPATGGVPVTAEMNARLWALILSGKRELPKNWREMIAVENGYESWRFHLSGRIKTLVQYGKYMEGLAELVGCKPHLRAMFLTNPRLWYHCWFGPHLACQYRLRGPHATPEVAKHVMLNYAPNPWPWWIVALNTVVTAVSIVGTPFGIFPTGW
jgi:dimethylaniline monooxygenase (N-oxide forming)